MGYDDVSNPEIINQLYDKHSVLTENCLTKNDSRLNMPDEIFHPIKTLYYQVDDDIKLASVSNNP